MSSLIQARGLSKRFGSQVALDRVDFDVKHGRIVGLIGPNGAGKTTALRAVLGLTSYDGQLEVLGREPFRERARLMEEASFIADVAVLPSWLSVDHARPVRGPKKYQRMNPRMGSTSTSTVQSTLSPVLPPL